MSSAWYSASLLRSLSWDSRFWRQHAVLLPFSWQKDCSKWHKIKTFQWRGVRGAKSRPEPGILLSHHCGDWGTNSPPGYSSCSWAGTLLAWLYPGNWAPHLHILPFSLPTKKLQVCVSFTTIFGSRKTEDGSRGMNFQSIAWQISTQITLLLMGFVGISFMLCFENPFHSVYWRTQGNKSVSLEGGDQFEKKKTKNTQNFFWVPLFLLCEHSDNEASYRPSSIFFSIFNNINSKESN